MDRKNEKNEANRAQLFTSTTCLLVQADIISNINMSECIYAAVEYVLMFDMFW